MPVAIWSFIACLSAITLFGTLSVLYKRKSTEDYLLASRDVPAWLSALSAVSTNNSGFMFIAMIGYSYRWGLESLWMMVGWTLGDVVGWLFFYPRLRRQGEDVEANTLSELLGSHAGGSRGRVVVAAAGAITFLFLGIYAAGQLKAGSTALHALFDWDMKAGVFIAAGIVILYSFAGGIRADIWTDAAQSFVMIGAMVMLLIAGWMEIGGPGALLDDLHEQDPGLTDYFPEDVRFGVVPWILGMFFGGLGAVGQPHLMVRYMAIESKKAIGRARIYYFMWYLPFWAASVGVGLYCRALIPDLASRPGANELKEPTELALPVMTMELLPEVFVGVALAGLFAAIVSTADSQIIVCSGSLTQDLFPRWRESYLASKVGTFTVTAMALSVALYAPEGVFGLVMIAWSAMGVSLGGLLMLRVYGRDPPQGWALAMMLAGIAAVAAWWVVGLDDDVLKALPGFAAAAAVYGAWLLRRRLRRR